MIAKVQKDEKQKLHVHVNLSMHKHVNTEQEYGRHGDLR